MKPLPAEAGSGGNTISNWFRCGLTPPCRTHRPKRTTRTVHRGFIRIKSAGLNPCQRLTGHSLRAFDAFRIWRDDEQFQAGTFRFGQHREFKPNFAAWKQAFGQF